MFNAANTIEAKRYLRSRLAATYSMYTKKGLGSYIVLTNFVFLSHLLAHLQLGFLSISLSFSSNMILISLEF